jgi:hypothetical protein
MTDTTSVQNNLEDRVISGYGPAQLAAPMLIEPAQRRVRPSGPLSADRCVSYREPIRECPKIGNLVCLFNERVDTYVDGNKIEVPRTAWSNKRLPSGRPRVRGQIHR